MLVSALLCYAGFMALCLAMQKHHASLVGRQGAPGLLRALRWAGWCLLGLSPWPAMAAQGWAFGLVQWCAVLMASAGLLVWLLPYRPRLAVGLAGVCVIAGPAGALLAGFG
ncbi:DUF3325 domain-containing protein [Pseudomonas typographi]|uniref:DUF3325 domain-containing protein n=1 Tax=Pseudomonas typographi TaxID=2715964 RepID=A0ABR7YYK6_9PSED|nr:DUF3325 domain-containing protein [Pseudomonas typographi]MBD1550826.1 DUF3325 domain-containing protein [Pseudomonas typographi]MBD1598291.1 DUF3325 domain-containing protein [Pseudomonas typographi]